jgi:hypothetical protein
MPPSETDKDDLLVWADLTTESSGSLRVHQWKIPKIMLSGITLWESDKDRMAREAFEHEQWS